MSPAGETPEAAAYAREVLRLDTETGILYWRVKRGRSRAGDQAGNVGSNGHHRVGLLKRYFQAHRVIWMLTRGQWPSGLIDHIDRNPLNNRPWNLRLVNKSQNAQNSLSTRSRSGLRGVSWSASSHKFRARISVNGKHLILGYFDSAAEAHECYLSYRPDIHPYAPLEANAKAIESGGGKCPSRNAAVPVSGNSEQYTDPIVRARLNLPPLK